MSKNIITYIILIILICLTVIASFVLLYYLFLENINKFTSYLKSRLNIYRENKKLNKIIDNNNLKKIRKHNEICIICMEEGNKKFLELKCKHLYHKKCLKKWIIDNNSCPLCRLPVVIV